MDGLCDHCFNVFFILYQLNNKHSYILAFKTKIPFNCEVTTIKSKRQFFLYCDIANENSTYTSVVLVTSCNFRFSFSQIWPKETILVLVLVVLDLRYYFLL